MQLKDSYILIKNQKIKVIEKVLLLIVIAIPSNSILYLINYIASEPSIKGKVIFKSFVKGISRYVF